MAKKKKQRKVMPKRIGANCDLKAKGGIESNNGRDINTRTDLVAVWLSRGMLSDTHKAAIAYCLSLWQLLGELPNVTASYGELIGGSVSSDSGFKTLKKVDAQNALKRIAGHIVFDDDGGQDFIAGYVTPRQFMMFENCIRFDEPTGYRSSSLVVSSKAKKTKAFHCVCLVAEIISAKEKLN